MTTYKFLARGAVGTLSGFKWPEPAPAPTGAGDWVETQGPLELCLRGVHVCRPADLSYWLHDELWRIEVDGDHLEGIDCLVVRRARLLTRIDAWHEGGASLFARACLQHATERADHLPQAAGADVRGFLEDAEQSARHGYFAVSAFSAARAVAGLSPAAELQAFREERRWQSDWIQEHLLDEKMTP
jgi:hypothetical protein